MIFLRYESFRSYVRQYPGTTLLVVINVIYFIVLALQGNTNDPTHLKEFGGLISNPEVAPYGMLEPWRFFTAMFMHSGFDHLLYNMFALIVFAPPLEHLLKTSRYLIFYFLSGIGGGLASAAATTWFGDPQVLRVAVGASGAIYGVYGAFLFIALFRKTMLDVSSIKTIYIILGFGVVYSIIITRIDFWGHVGGAIAGFLLYSLFDRLRMSKLRNK
ncbi:rhomboid family intramembrane serine protease [Paenibacillus yanchengensis]|uniref:Rhomboid family intramembrane serine protease n=1 Tax=Paenibacillus yanchengensis TaxID=2035833 RepID=A0ABW4YNK8_9BACL